MQVIDMLLTNINRPRRANNPRVCVIHWTGNPAKGADAVANARYFNRPYKVAKGEGKLIYLEMDGQPFNYASAHYVVDDKRVVRCIPENEMAYHVGSTKYKPDALRLISNYPNNASIGVEMCVNSDGDFKKTYANTVTFVADILKRYGWSTARLWRHYDVTGKDCPRYFVDDATARKFGFASAAAGWEKFKKDVQAELSSLVGKSIDGYVAIVVNGRELKEKGILVAGTSYAPVRPLAEALGLKVGWDGRVLLSRQAVVEGTAPVVLDGRELEKEAVIVDGRSYLPVREIAETLGLKVGWDGRVLLDG